MALTEPSAVAERLRASADADRRRKAREAAAGGPVPPVSPAVVPAVPVEQPQPKQNQPKKKYVGENYHYKSPRAAYERAEKAKQQAQQQLTQQVSPQAANALMGQKFIDTLFAPARHKALYGGRGSAKSWSVATYLAVLASRERKLIVCARQFQNSIRDSSKELVEKRIRMLGLEPQFDVQEQVIVHKGTKARFLFVGLERNIDSIRSLEGADVVWIDEARTIKAKSMEILLPTIRNQNSELIWTWNPERPEDPVDKYFREGEKPPNSIITFVDHTDNPFFNLTAMPGEMELMKRGNPTRYRHVWLGDYDLSHDTKIFTNVRIGRVEIPDNVPPRFGLDFGFGKDPSFAVKVYLDLAARRLYIAREASGRVTMDQLPALVRDVIDHSDDLIIADTSQPGTIEFLEARGFNIMPARKGSGSVKAGINFLQGFEIVIDPDCEEMREESRLYSWMTDRLTGKPLNVPLDAHNHGWDATRYATESAQHELQLDAYGDDGGVLKLKFW